MLHQQLVEDMTECEKLEILTKSQNHEIDFLETKAMMLAAVTYALSFLLCAGRR